MKSFFLIPVLLEFTAVYEVESLYCQCQFVKCPIPPKCPPFESLVPDVCHCCMVCGKRLGENCGGPWWMEGRCSLNWRCERSDPNNPRSVGICKVIIL